MPILNTELKKYQAASMPETDAATSGGAIATAGLLEISQLAANDAVGVVSDGADARTVTITGRTAAGAIASEALVLNGATRVAGAQVFERILKVVISAADAARTVTVTRNTGGANVATLGPNKTSTRLLNYDSKSEAAITTRYEKEFWKNENATLTLNGATMKLTADPSAKYKIGCATTKNDSGSVANRKTAPGGITFVDDNIDAGIPGGNLAAGDAIGVWIEQTLGAGAAPEKTSYTTELAGTTT